MRVQDYCKQDVITIEEQASVVEAAGLMRRHHCGALVLVRRDGRIQLPTGIVTDRDLVIEVIAQGLEPAKVRVGDLVTDNLIQVCESDPLEAALELMSKHQIRRVPVVDLHGGLAGLLCADDLITSLSDMLGHIADVTACQWEQEAERRR